MSGPGLRCSWRCRTSRLLWQILQVYTHCLNFTVYTSLCVCVCVKVCVRTALRQPPAGACGGPQPRVQRGAALQYADRSVAFLTHRWRFSGRQYGVGHTPIHPSPPPPPPPPTFAKGKQPNTMALCQPPPTPTQFHRDPPQTQIHQYAHIPHFSPPAPKEEEEGHRVVRGRWAPPPMKGKGPREGQSASWCRQLQTKTQHGVLPNPPRTRRTNQQNSATPPTPQQTHVSKVWVVRDRAMHQPQPIASTDVAL